MNAPRWKGVRFHIPGFDAAPPGFVFAPQGGLETVADRTAVRQALLLLLLTRRGERVMRPDYGCDLHRMMFWPNDDTTAGLAIHYVRRAVEQWEPRVDHVRVDAGRDPDDPARLVVWLEYRVRATGEEDRVAVQLDLGETPV
jgi:hypothetical protein